MNKQSKSYRVTLRTGKSFSLILSGFQFATSLFFRIRDRMRINFSPSFRIKAVTTITIKKVRLIVSQVKLITKITQTISSRTIKITYLMRQTMKAVTTISFEHPFIFVSKARQKLVTTIKEGKLVITAVATVAQFFTLGHFDPDTLLVLDTQTLGDMDYVVV